jgi:hypothetical protein
MWGGMDCGAAIGRTKTLTQLPVVACFGCIPKPVSCRFLGTADMLLEKDRKPIYITGIGL